MVVGGYIHDNKESVGVDDVFVGGDIHEEEGNVIIGDVVVAGDIHEEEGSVIVDGVVLGGDIHEEGGGGGLAEPPQPGTGKETIQHCITKGEKGGLQRVMEKDFQV